MDPTEDAFLMLTKDGQFYTAYLAQSKEWSPCCSEARNTINNAMRRLKCAAYSATPGNADIAVREGMRVRFDANRGISGRPRDTSSFGKNQAARAAMEAITCRETPVAEATQQPKQPEDFPMNFTTKTLLNGADITTLSNAAIYEAIAAEEARLAKLKSIEHKPSSLVKELLDGEDNIRALVVFLDARG